MNNALNTGLFYELDYQTGLPLIPPSSGADKGKTRRNLLILVDLRKLILGLYEQPRLKFGEKCRNSRPSANPYGPKSRRALEHGDVRAEKSSPE